MKLVVPDCSLKVLWSLLYLRFVLFLLVETDILLMIRETNSKLTCFDKKREKNKKHEEEKFSAVP